MNYEQQPDIFQRINIMTEKEKEALKAIQETPIAQLERLQAEFAKLKAQIKKEMEQTLMGEIFVQMCRDIIYAIEHPLKTARKFLLFGFLRK